MKTIKVKKHTDKYGFKYMQYKDINKVCAYIRLPHNLYDCMYKDKFYAVLANLGAPYDTLEKAQAVCEKYLKRCYLENIQIQYQNEKF